MGWIVILVCQLLIPVSVTYAMYDCIYVDNIYCYSYTDSVHYEGQVGQLTDGRAQNIRPESGENCSNDHSSPTTVSYRSNEQSSLESGCCQAMPTKHNS